MTAARVQFFPAICMSSAASSRAEWNTLPVRSGATSSTAGASVLVELAGREPGIDVGRLPALDQRGAPQVAHRTPQLGQ